jgi:hypothetical protein
MKRYIKLFETFVDDTDEQDLDTWAAYDGDEEDGFMPDEEMPGTPRQQMMNHMDRVRSTVPMREWPAVGDEEEEEEMFVPDPSEPGTPREQMMNRMRGRHGR